MMMKMKKMLKAELIGLEAEISDSKNKDNIQEIFIEEINRHIEKAEELGKSKIIPDSPYKDLLAEFPRYIINEMLKEIKIAV